MKASIPRNTHCVRYRSFLGFGAVVFLLLQTLPVWAQVGPRGMRRVPQLPAGHSTVKGRVIYKDNLQPLKGAHLRIFSSGDDEGELVVFANERGEFRADNLAAGKYYVALEGSGIAMQSGFGMKIPLPLSAIPKAEDFEEIVPKHDAEFTVDGTNNIDVDIRIERGGKLAGKVLKPNGAPANDVDVMLVSRTAGEAGPYTARYSTRTDNDGAYRFENLPSGDFVVGAAIDSKPGSTDIRARLRGESQVVTYHPAATTVRDAQTVHVDSGGAVSGINITLVVRDSFAVSGTVVQQRDGTALAGATVLLRNRESELGGSLVPGVSQRTTRTDAEGHWAFNNVAEGSYVVTALAPLVRSGSPDGMADREEMYRRSRQRFLIAQQDVIVAGGSLTDLLLSITGSGSIAGVVELDNGQALPPGLVVFLELVRTGGRPGPPLPVRVQPDGSFSFSEVQGGDVYVSVALPQEANFFVKSVTSNGNDLRSKPLNVGEGTIAGPIRVVLSTELGRLAGQVISDKKDALGDFIVLLAPVETEKGRFRSAYFTTRTGGDGSYSLSVAPGEYFVFARRRDQLPGLVSDEFVRKEAGSATRVTIAPREQKRFDPHAP